jgi:NTE family protein
LRKIGLCLGGGGARGPYEIGVAKALKDLKVFKRISVFSGTSIGAVNVAFLAANGVRQSEKLWLGISENEIKTAEGTFRRIIREKLRIAEDGLYDISALRTYLQDNLDFAKLKEKEVYVTLSEGGGENESIIGLLKSTYRHFVKKDSKVLYCRLGEQTPELIMELIIASCSIPIVFPPVKMNEKKYYDGGVYDNVPVEPLVQAGCDTIIVAHLLLLDFIDKNRYPGINFLEIRHFSPLGGLLNFSPNRVASLVDLGYRIIFRKTRFSRICWKPLNKRNPPLFPYYVFRNGKGGFFMKKIVLLSMVAILAGISWFSRVEADTYGNYQEIVFDQNGNKMLKEFTQEQYLEYYGLIPTHYFMGWKLLIVTKNQAVDFISETKLKIYNSGYSTIKHEITLKSEEETKFQLSASGSISISVKGDIKKFKGGLDADIKASVDYETKTTTSEEYVFKITVDPGTYITIITKGEGVVNNGVAKNYFFWILTQKGGWETFLVTTEYYEIIKEKIR